MDLQFGIFVGVDRHDESKLESRVFFIGFQSITSSGRSHNVIQRSQLRSNEAVLQQSDLAVLLTNCCATYQSIPLQRCTTARQYTDSR